MNVSVVSHGAPSPTLEHEAHQPALSSPIGDSERQTVLTAVELESAISRAGAAMESAYAQYQRTQRNDDLDRAYRHMQQMHALVGKRSPQTVHSMEAERGLS